MTLTASTTGANTALTFPLTTNWQRISIPVNLGQATTSVTFGAQLAAGATVDLFGMQVEAQAGAVGLQDDGHQRRGVRECAVCVGFA